MPKDVQPRRTNLKKVLDKETFERLNAERKNGRTHTLTTEQLIALVDAVTNAQPAPRTIDLNAVSAAKSAKVRNNKISRKRRQIIDDLDVTQLRRESIVAHVPLTDDFVCTPLADRLAILRCKVDATLNRLRAFNKVGNSGLFDEANSNKHRKFIRGFQDLNKVSKRLDIVVNEITAKEWSHLNWGFSAVAQTKFTRLRSNFHYILRQLAEIFDRHFSFISDSARATELATPVASLSRQA